MTDPRVLPAGERESLEAAVEALRAGGIVAVPTETLYGLAVLAERGPLAAVLAAKRRPQEKGIALAVDSIEQLERLARLPAPARRLAERFWPGPLTLVLPPRREVGVDLPAPLMGPTGAIGFRLPDHAAPRDLARALGPIALTSANVSGGPDAYSVADLLGTVGPSLALVLDDGPVRGGIGSTVVEVDLDGAVRILRAGPLDPSEVAATLA